MCRVTPVAPLTPFPGWGDARVPAGGSRHDPVMRTQLIARAANIVWTGKL